MWNSRRTLGEEFIRRDITVEDRQTVKEVAGTLQRGQAVVVPDKDCMAEVSRSPAVAFQELGWLHSINLLKLSGENEKETRNVQQTCLGVY